MNKTRVVRGEEKETLWCAENKAGPKKNKGQNEKTTKNPRGEDTKKRGDIRRKD